MVSTIKPCLEGVEATLVGTVGHQPGGTLKLMSLMTLTLLFLFAG